MIISLFITTAASAQFGNYQSVNRPFGARNAALGGRVVSLADGDVMQFVYNPAVLDSVKTGSTGINFSPYFAGIHSFSGAYAGNFKKIGKLAMGISYMNYGEFTQTAPNGANLGTFNANDYLIVVGKSHTIASFTLGANLKFAANNIAGYGSSVVMADLGGIYRAPKSDFTFGLVLKNFGFVLDDYTGVQSNQVPFDVQMSTTFKPEHMPFRFSLSAYNLTSNNLFFTPEGIASQSKSVKIADKIFRHINVGTELVIHESIQLLIGYSQLVHQELKVGNTAYGAGFSYGFAIRIKQFRIRYSHATYHAAGGTDFFTLQTNLKSFKKIL